jgi:hypothetical protein
MAFSTDSDNRRVGKNLGDLLTDSDEQSFVWRSFLQSLQDHGGNIHHLNNLLKNTRKTRLIIDKWAKLTMGKIWTLTETPIDLWMDHDGGVKDDFDCTPEQFLRRYSGPVESMESGEYSGTKPRTDCQYRLHHFSRRMSAEEVVGVFDQDKTLEHAGWRELHVYTHWASSRELMSPADLHGSYILACDSRLLTTEQDSVKRIPRDGFFSLNAHMSCKDEFDTSLYPTSDGTGLNFAPNCFFLVRVYEE